MITIKTDYFTATINPRLGGALASFEITSEDQDGLAFSTWFNNANELERDHYLRACDMFHEFCKEISEVAGKLYNTGTFETAKVNNPFQWFAFNRERYLVAEQAARASEENFNKNYRTEF